MLPKEPTRAQLSSRLAYTSETPAFLRRLQNQVAGRGSRDDDEDDPQYVDGVDEFGRERRPPIPERPEYDARGSDDDDFDDEKPVVVVVKEGKHLTELEALSEKRKAQGLPPLPSQAKDKALDSEGAEKVATSSSTQDSGLSFSSKNAEKAKGGFKRKLPEEAQKTGNSPGKSKKKAKKSQKGSLSFDRDDMG